MVSSIHTLKPTQSEDWVDMSWEERDRWAWEAVRCWHENINFDPVRDKLDYALLTRWFLWDKVGRAIRCMTDPEDYELEIELLKWNQQPASTQFTHSPSPKPFTTRARNRILSMIKRDAIRPSIPENTYVLYVPQPNPRIEQACLSMINNYNVAVVTGQGSTELPGTFAVPTSLKISPPDETWATTLTDAIANGLIHFGIILHEFDISKLRDQIINQVRHIKRAEAELKWVRPNALLLHADNHPRPINYVLLCKKLNIPTIMLQHGLDCERYYLDDAYASHIAVWGPERKTRYESSSAWQPKRIEVTGNPEFDFYSKPTTIDLKGSYWLWASRPHAPDKCYAPSRSVAEGLHILDTLIKCLKKYPDQHLIIKPHPYDPIDGYRNCISYHGIENRVQIQESALENWLPDASLVITEDTTSGLQAMFLGKNLIHVHLAPTPPTMPFGESGAAISGYSLIQIEEAIDKALHLSENSLESMIKAQQQMLQEFAGPCDGQSSDRIRILIEQTLGILK